MPAPRKPHGKPGTTALPPDVWFWAKTKRNGDPGISVLDHCLNVGTVAAAFLRVINPYVRRLAPPCAPVLAALHDVGKIAPGFQAQCEKWLLNHGLRTQALSECWALLESDHAKLTQHTLQQLWGSGPRLKWAAALGAHHGRLKGLKVNCPDHWSDHRYGLLEEIAGQLGTLPTEGPESDAQLWWVAGLVTVADWLGSDERYFPSDGGLSECERRQRAYMALEQIGWAKTRIRKGLDFQDLFPGFRPNPLQQTLFNLTETPGVYVVEAPMGCGKTEAALAAAYKLLDAGKASGIYFALPTQLTSNRIHRRVQEFVVRIAQSQTNVRLAHSASWLTDTTLPPELPPSGPAAEGETKVQDLARSWFASPKRALLEPFGVGTVDQALLGVVAAKHFFVRQFALAGKVVILDEVHSYDVYTGSLITQLVRQLRDLHSTVIILSATLTHQRRLELLGAEDGRGLGSSYPLVSCATESISAVPCDAPPSRRIGISWRQPQSLAEECLERAEGKHCVLWICNTVARAQQNYLCLKSLACEGGPKIGLLHSRFPLSRREKLEDFWMEALGREGHRPSGCVLVATQVVEQSVDVDADLLVTELAPSDMLFQRLGRLWRHPRRWRPAAQPEVWIEIPAAPQTLKNGSRTEIVNALGPSARVYAPYVLLRSWDLWRNRKTICLPEEIREVLEQTYAEPSHSEPRAWQDLFRDLQCRRNKLQGLAWNAMSIWDRPALEDEEEAQTRYSSLPTGLLLPVRRLRESRQSAEVELLDGQSVTMRPALWDFDTAKQIHRSLIRAPWYALREGVLNAPVWLRRYAERACLAVLREDGQLEWPHSGERSGLSYHDELGLRIDAAQIKRAPREEEFDESCY